jgi:shikimate dehydrogenase
VLNAAVLGRPVAHSLSPLLHTAAYRALGLEQWRYAAHDVGADELPGWVADLDDSWRGLSLTMPLKEVAFEVATTTSDTARATGAVNTLVRRSDLGWDAHNTDVKGLVQALGAVDHGGSATLLGSGATARSAALALVELGVTEVRVAARNAVSAAEVLSLLEGRGVGARLVPLPDWARERTGLCVSTLPAAASESAGAALEGAGQAVRGVVLMDVVYADWPTPLARAATLAGMQPMSGLDMLVHQAAEQFRLFTGLEAPVGAMLSTGRRAVAQ